MKEQIRHFILKALLAADGDPMAEFTLKSAIRSAFMQVAFTDSDLVQHVQFCEAQGWIIGTNSALAGTVWAITNKGRLEVRQLR